VDEVRLGGPVQYCWIYPIERFLGKIKGFVGNRAHPEGSIAEGWILDEMFTFSSLYFNDEVETRFNREKRVHEPVEEDMYKESTLFPVLGKPVGAEKIYKLSEIELMQAHRHVLVNSDGIAPFIEEFRAETKQKYKGARAQQRATAEIEK
ncbi:hypothetical protein LINPERPRIM_LOCUS14967, partial [Linum perenne]